MKNLFVAMVASLVVVFAPTGWAKDLPDFTELVEKSGAAVVNISTTQVIKGGRAGAFPFQFGDDDQIPDFMRRFFPGQIPGQPGFPRQPDYQSRSLGSGFIISADGHILTNAHVVDAADEVTVKLTDKREFKAKVLGADKRTDVALIKIEASNLPVARLGDPAKLKVGEWVIAIGSPFGFESSVTAGIVSAKGRSLTQENYVPFIQTDVAVNPGNSGGPLFNMKGEVVGINSQIYSNSGGSIGLSFSIPIDLAMDVQNQLRTKGKVSRGRLGVVIQEVSKELAETFGLSKPQGALVASVEKGAAADKAGMVSGDIILKFDGKAVSESSDLPRMVGTTKPGAKVPVQVWRKGATHDLSVTVGEIPDEEGPGRDRSKRGKSDDAVTNSLGLALSPLNPEQRKSLGVQSGLIVEDVQNAGLRTDLRRGDIILSVMVKGAQVDVRSVSQFNEIIAGFDKKANITLLVRRGDSQTFVIVRGAADKKGESGK